nr:MAG TPA: hypothetical protein [Caudoviricetes sp.]
MKTNQLCTAFKHLQRYKSISVIFYSVIYYLSNKTEMS